MENNHSYGYTMFYLFLMSLSLNIPLILIGAPMWVLTLVIIAVFSSALSGSMAIAYAYRLMHNLILRPGLYIWALIVTIAGPQDIVAIGFYVIFGCQLKNIIENFIGEIIILSNKF